MIKSLVTSLIHKKFLSLVIIFLSIMPFWWYEPGALDFGGDSNRLFFYDPYAVLVNEAYYNIRPEGMGKPATQTVILPYTFFIYLLHLIIPSGQIIIALLNSLKLVGGFLGVYLILMLLLNREKGGNKTSVYFAAVLAGLLYVASPIIIGNFDKSLLSHDQVFLNPLLFYLILQYVLQKKYIYMLILLLLTFPFAHAFAWISAPALFAFYPLSIAAICLYALWIKKTTIPFRGLLLSFVILILLHMVHILPTIFLIFQNSQNFINTAIFSENKESLVNYFYAVLSSSKVSVQIPIYSRTLVLFITSICVPIIIMLSFMIKKTEEQKRILILFSIFWLILFFLVTANITYIGVKVYAQLFKLPGFGMFRNFNGQWAFAFSFYFALVAGIAFSIVLPTLKSNLQKAIVAFIIVVILIQGFPYVTGDRVNKIHHESKGVRIGTVMNPTYSEVLSFVRRIPEDAKILTLPFSDFEYQIIHGRNKGAYVGPSTLRLTGKMDFAGFATLPPFDGIFYELVKQRDYKKIRHLFSLLNIHYIFYNSDEDIYDKTFYGYPYSHSRTVFPQTQKDYMKFIHELGVEKMYQKDTYTIYKLNHDLLPHIYSPGNIETYGTVDDIFKNEKTTNSVVYLDHKTCELLQTLYDCNNTNNQNKKIAVNSERINPTKYTVSLKGVKDSHLIVFSEGFADGWTVTLSKGNKEIPKEQHVSVNGYANGWLIQKSDIQDQSTYHATIEYKPQRLVKAGLYVSFGVFALLIFTLLFMVIHMKGKMKKDRELP